MKFYRLFLFFYFISLSVNSNAAAVADDDRGYVGALVTGNSKCAAMEGNDSSAAALRAEVTDEEILAFAMAMVDDSNPSAAMDSGYSSASSARAGLGYTYRPASSREPRFVAESSSAAGKVDVKSTISTWWIRNEKYLVGPGDCLYETSRLVATHKCGLPLIPSVMAKLSGPDNPFYDIEWDSKGRAFSTDFSIYFFEKSGKKSIDSLAGIVHLYPGYALDDFMYSYAYFVAHDKRGKGYGSEILSCLRGIFINFKTYRCPILSLSGDVDGYNVASLKAHRRSRLSPTELDIGRMYPYVTFTISPTAKVVSKSELAVINLLCDDEKRRLNYLSTFAAKEIVKHKADMDETMVASKGEVDTDDEEYYEERLAILERLHAAKTQKEAENALLDYYGLDK